ncbi:NUDIX hydrolase [Candidatus Woesearchaeota archaeon]|nr:NUDIX hydrolase [Candidatus Woesearchaeota archaeon]
MTSITSLQNDDEFLDLVNENDEVIGKEKRSKVYSSGIHNYRVINAFVVNSKGQLWIPRRTSTKKIFPLGLDISVGGHVESGEDYAESFKREVKEELNVDIDSVNWKFLGKLTPKEGVSSFMKVYEIDLEEVENYNKEDFISYEWLYPAEVLEKIKLGDKTKDDLPKIIKLIYLK